MSYLTGDERASYVREMFARIAPRYDLMNRLMTGGQDVAWRREVIQRAGLRSGQRLLDLGAGTGDLAYLALRQVPGCQVVAADFTLEMMQAGRKGTAGDLADPGWTAADALHLPFPDCSFDAVVSGFLLRNVADVHLALSEQYRLLKEGGRVVALDTTRPGRNLLSPMMNFHLHTVIPAMGRLLGSDSSAYTYLPDSTESFLAAETLAVRMVDVGFREVGFRRLMFGAAAIHWGVK
jgi:demethylmenaquinone methyltransferase / 2-methoxy-6-polyprenyl-1,4-benzoquinol methylase